MNAFQSGRLGLGFVVLGGARPLDRYGTELNGTVRIESSLRVCIFCKHLHSVLYHSMTSPSTLDSMISFQFSTHCHCVGDAFIFDAYVTAQKETGKKPCRDKYTNTTNPQKRCGHRPKLSRRKGPPTVCMSHSTLSPNFEGIARKNARFFNFPPIPRGRGRPVEPHDHQRNTEKLSIKTVSSTWLMLLLFVVRLVYSY